MPGSVPKDGSCIRCGRPDASMGSSIRRLLINYAIHEAKGAPFLVSHREASSYCATCLAHREKEKALQIPEMELPLYISYAWYTKMGKETYLNRLRGIPPSVLKTIETYNPNHEGGTPSDPKETLS